MDFKHRSDGTAVKPEKIQVLETNDFGYKTIWPGEPPPLDAAFIVTKEHWEGMTRYIDEFKIVDVAITHEPD